MVKQRSAILHFVLWLAIVRTVFNHCYLLSHIADISPHDHKRRTEFALSNDFHHRSLQQTQGQPARFLMGIFTVQDKKRLRDAVRRTIRWYNDSRVCSIGSINGTFPSPPPEHCQIIYTFVMGANPNGTTQLFEDSSSDVSILTMPPKSLKGEASTNDITFLNIKENMNDGKSPTWFNYASRIMSKFDLDYAIKCDMDTALRVDKFLEFADNNLPRGGRHIYSGKVVFSSRTKRPYMEGQFYLLSRDLAEAVGNMPLNKTKEVVTNLEDADVGAMVSDAFPSIHYVPVIPIEKYLPWRHQLKGEVYHRWFLQLESSRLCGIDDNVTISPAACYPPVAARR